MTADRGHHRRTIIVTLVAAAVLVGLVLATGGGYSMPGSSPTSPATPTTPSGTATAGMRATVSVAVQRGRAHAYTFTYLVRNRGQLPIGGFQINGQAANLFHIRIPTGWNAFGAGVCKGNYPGVLIYWSTGVGGIPPKQSERFSFSVNTGGVTSRQYSLSQGQSVLFARAPGPQPSSLPASGACSGHGGH